MSEKEMTAQVHRFRDKVAIRIGEGKTYYLTDREATRLATALSWCVVDISGHGFQDSKFETRTITFFEEK